MHTVTTSTTVIQTGRTYTWGEGPYRRANSLWVSCACQWVNVLDNYSILNFLLSLLPPWPSRHSYEKAYLLRNEILTNVEALQAELDFLLKDGDEDTEDLFKYSSEANRAMDDYLNNIGPGEKNKAKALLAAERS